MFNKIIIAALSVCAISTNAFACNTASNWFSNGHFAVQGALTSGGNLSIGFADYTPCLEFGANASGSIVSTNTGTNTQTFSPGIFAGLRTAIAANTFFAYGANAGITVGHIGGVNINSSFGVGPYVSLEQMLNDKLLLTGWINPYAYRYQKLGVSERNTHNFFTSGGIALEYYVS